ncbi:MAG: glycosyltransferase family 4 protein [Gemmatimonadetes bacterium]|nr:glycosyltransferase family 4 protein [Gemmatimonadota bacterium]
MPLSLLLLSAFFAPDPIAKRMTGLARALATRGHQVTVVTRWPATLDGAPLDEESVAAADRALPAGIRVLRVGAGGEAKRGSAAKRIAAQVSFAGAALARGALLPGRYQGVIAYTPPPFVGAAALLVARVRRTALILEVQDLYPDQAIALGVVREGLVTAASRLVERAMYRGATRLVVVTHGYREHVVERGVPAGRVVVLPNSCDPDLFRPEVAPLGDGQLRGTGPGERVSELADEGVPGGGDASCASASAWGPLPQRHLRVVFAGTVGLAQGLDVVLDAAQRLRSRGDIRFEVFGGGARFAALEHEAAARGLTNVHFGPGVPHAEMPRVLARADVLLLTLHPHPVFGRVVPSKLSECLAMGRPVVAAASGEVAALLEAVGAGVAVPPGDGAALARAVAELAAAPERRSAMGARARAVALERFADGVILAHYVGLIEELLSGVS